VIVIVVMSVIAAIAIPRMSNAAQRSRFANTIATYNAIERAVEYYRSDFGAFPPDHWEMNDLPQLRSYIGSAVFLRPSPLGGYWDWNNKYNASGAVVNDWVVIGPNVSIVQSSPPLTLWTAFDKHADDGSLTTGRFTRQRARFLISKVPE
jgi:type II secretory pathway pseudopilin PulG